MTCRTEKIIIEKKGINAFKTLVEEQGSIFREISGCDDIGHDGNIEICTKKDDKYFPTGIEIKVQIKSGESYFKGNNAFIKGDKKHFEYWKIIYCQLLALFTIQKIKHYIGQIYPNI